MAKKRADITVSVRLMKDGTWKGSARRGRKSAQSTGCTSIGEAWESAVQALLAVEANLGLVRDKKEATND